MNTLSPLSQICPFITINQINGNNVVDETMQQVMKKIHAWFIKLFWNMGVTAIPEKPYTLNLPPYKQRKHIQYVWFSYCLIIPCLFNFCPELNYMIEQKHQVADLEREHMKQS